MNAVCEALGVARSNIAAGLRSPIAKPLKRVGRRPRRRKGSSPGSRRSSAISRPMAIAAFGRCSSVRAARKAGAGQRQARSSGDESPCDVASAPCRRGRRAPPRRQDRRRALKPALVFGRLRVGLRQWREGACRLRPRLLRPRGDGQGRDHARHQGGRCSRSHDASVESASVRSIACRGPSNGSATTDQATSPRRPEPSPATSASSR